MKRLLPDGEIPSGATPVSSSGIDFCIFQVIYGQESDDVELLHFPLLLFEAHRHHRAEDCEGFDLTVEKWTIVKIINVDFEKTSFKMIHIQH